MGKGKAAELQAELHDELQRERDKNAGLEEAVVALQEKFDAA